jgi:hypothetical protein
VKSHSGWGTARNESAQYPDGARGTALLQKLQEGKDLQRQGAERISAGTHHEGGEAPFPLAQVETRGTSAVEEYVFGRRLLVMMMMAKTCRDKALSASRQGHIGSERRVAKNESAQYPDGARGTALLQKLQEGESSRLGVSSRRVEPEVYRR